MARVRKSSNPPMFQGNVRKKQYFEGWYYKLVDATESHVYAFIPGISLDRKHDTSHTFVQMLNGKTGKTSYFQYPLADFWASKKSFQVKVGPNSFASDRLELRLEGDGPSIAGALVFTDLVPWPKFRFAPGVMGWYQHMPFMECFHGVVSLNHAIAGSLTIDGEVVDFSCGRGYTAKDWGKSFPSGYVWMQSNHFAQGPTSFMASIARIPWLGRHFTGFLVVLWHGGKIYRLTTYTGAKILWLEISPKSVETTIGDKYYLAEIKATKTALSPATEGQESAGVLKSPTQGAMQSRIMESLTGLISVKLFARERNGEKGALLLEDTGRNAGVEIQATLEQLQL